MSCWQWVVLAYLSGLATVLIFSLVFRNADPVDEDEHAQL